MKRILYLIKGLARGGAEQLLVSQGPYLDRGRFEYEVAYLLSDHRALVMELEGSGVPAHCLYGARGAGWVGRLRRLVRERDIDLVHIHSPYVAVGARLGLWGIRPRPRIVYTEHSVWSFYHRATYWGNVLTYPRSDHVFAVSDHVRASIRYPRGLGFLPMPPVETLYHGVDPAAVRRWGNSNGVRAELGIPADAPLVGMVGNLRPGKGHHNLLKAAVRVRRVLPDVRFVLVGHGPLEPDLRRRTRALGLDGTVIFTGARDDAPRVAGAFDVFALPSSSEGLAIALIEAMTLGRPSVVTRVGGLTEVVQHGKNGLVVEPGDTESLADAILTLLRDPVLMRELGEAGRKRALRFDIRKATRRHEEVYAELLNC
jgi:glycosyltransferase involved in cell wall biosynthesis